MKEPTQESVSAVGTVSSQDRASSGFVPSGGAPEKLPDLPLVKQDSVEISAEARAAANSARRPAPAPPPVEVSNGNAEDLRFNYDRGTGTLQTQVIDPKTGKPIAEFPSDQQIKVRQSLQRIFRSRSTDSRR